MILVFSLMIALLLAIPILFLSILQTNRTLVKTTQHVVLADSMAEGALNEALGWFRSRPGKVDQGALASPDEAFQPQAIDGWTDDEAVGLVRDQSFGTDNNIWVRTEVRRQLFANPWDPLASHDITAERYPGRTNGEGLAWVLTGVAYVYRRHDAGAPFDTAPNEILARSRYSVEIRWLELNLPDTAALIVPSLDGLSTSAVGGILINGAGENAISASGGTLAPVFNAGGHVINGSVINTLPAYDVEGIFGVDKETLIRLSDQRLETESSVMGPYHKNVKDILLSYYSYRMASPVEMRLDGSGIAYLDFGGNPFKFRAEPIMSGGSVRVFEGILFLDGNQSTFNKFGTINGCVIALGGGGIVFSPEGTGIVINYSPGIIAQVRASVAGYRMYSRPRKIERSETS